MKRMIFAALTVAIATLATASAYADDSDLRTSRGVKHFWAEHHPESGGGN